MNASEISIRDAKAEDAANVLALLEPSIATKQLLPRTLEEIRQLSLHAFVAERGGVVVGFAAVEVYSKKMAELQCLAVAPDSQGQGVGGQLVKLCVERARSLGIMELMAITSSDELFLHCGFDYSLPDQKRALFVHTTGFRHP
jgi:amino-acid N-acetyltransferase